MARTNNVGVVLAQYLIVLLQHFLQLAVALGLGLLDQPLEGLHPLVVVAETGDEALEALVRGLVIPRSQARQN
jgi:hypothetical protein